MRQARSTVLLSKVKALPPALMTRDTLRELRTVFHVARPLLSTARLRSTPYGELDLVSRFTVPHDAHLDELERFASWLAGEERPPQGVDSLYLTPEAWADGPLALVATRYPALSGLKISKSLGDVRTPYMSMRSGRRVQRQLAGSARGPHRL